MYFLRGSPWRTPGKPKLRWSSYAASSTKNNQASPRPTNKTNLVKADGNSPEVNGTALTPNSIEAVPRMKPLLRPTKMKPCKKYVAAPIKPTRQPLPKIHRLPLNLLPPKQPKKACSRHGAKKLKLLPRLILMGQLPRRAAMKLHPCVNLPQNRCSCFLGKK